MKPIRIQRSRKKGSNIRKQSLDINGLEVQYVGRGSKWGNPFRVVQYANGNWSVKCDGTPLTTKILIEYCHFTYLTKEAATNDAIQCYVIWLDKVTDTHDKLEGMNPFIGLRGKNLSCWCKIGEKCHADILLELSNQVVL